MKSLLSAFGVKMRLCFGVAACYEPRGDYCKSCENKDACAKEVKSVISSIEAKSDDEKVLKSEDSRKQKEQFAESLDSLAKHPKKLVMSLFDKNLYVSADILGAGQRHRDRKVFWQAVSMLKSDGFYRAQLLDYAMSINMSHSTAQSEVTAAIKALEFYGMIQKNGKEYRLK